MQFKDGRTSVYGLFSLGDSPGLAEAERERRRRTQVKLAEELESYRRLLKIVADHDPLAALGSWTLAIVKRSDLAKGFELLPRRWVVERTLAWLNRNRRRAKDFEALIETATAWLMLASVKLLSRRLARDNQLIGY